MTLQTCVKISDARTLVHSAKRSGKRVGVVPTMGALHEGHLSLVRKSVEDCDYTVVTVFVNPTQFGQGEDFEQYPRNLAKDLEALEGCDVDLMFAPDQDQIYRRQHSTYVVPGAVSELFDGKLRPDHFRGVTTIVLKLFHIIPADVAFFGQKDYQQTRVIADMVQDLDLPIEIQVCPIVREPDGLAMSSRNVYLSTEERAQAIGLSQALNAAVAMFSTGEKRASVLEATMLERLADSGIHQLDYAAIVDPVTLQPVQLADRKTMALVAAYVGKTRLIDNSRLG